MHNPINRNTASTRRLMLMLTAVYLSLFVAGSASLVARSPALIDLVGIYGYYAWAVLFLAGSMLLLLGNLTKNKYVEVVGTLPAAAALIVYSLSLMIGSPYSQTFLGIMGAGVIGSPAWVLLWRFLDIDINNGGNPSVKL